MTRIEIILKESEEKVKIWLVLVRYGRTALLTMNGMIFIQNLIMKDSDHPEEAGTAVTKGPIILPARRSLGEAWEECRYKFILRPEITKDRRVTKGREGHATLHATQLLFQNQAVLQQAAFRVRVQRVAI